MKQENDLRFWISEGNLFRAEQVYLKIILDSPHFKNTDIAIKLQTDLIEHHQQIAGKAILAKNIGLLRATIMKLEFYNQNTSDLQTALNALQFKNTLRISIGLILFICLVYTLYSIIY